MKRTYMLSIDDDTIAKYLEDDSITFELANQKINVSVENLKEVITQIEAFKEWQKVEKEKTKNSTKAS